jgi:hypothetical protein
MQPAVFMLPSTTPIPQAQTCCRSRKLSLSLRRQRLLLRVTLIGTAGSPTTHAFVEAIGRTYPDVFHDFNKHMWSLGGFHRPLKARTSVEHAKPESEFSCAARLLRASRRVGSEELFDLITLRSNDQFNASAESSNRRRPFVPF